MSELSVEEIKKLRLCTCGQYKHSRKACCESCWNHLSEELKDSISGEFGMDYDDPRYVRVREQISEWMKTIEQIREAGVFTCPEMPNGHRYNILKELCSHKVRVSDKDFSWFMSKKTRAQMAHHHIQMRRSEIHQMIKKNLPNISSGMSKV